MPKWGLSMKEGSILKWIKSNGDDISKGDMILEIETEKVVNEMESPEDVDANAPAPAEPAPRK